MGHGLGEAFHGGGDPEHDRHGRGQGGAVDQALDDGGPLLVVLLGGLHAPVGLVQDEVQGPSGGGHGVGDDVVDGPLGHVGGGHHRGGSVGGIRGPAHQAGSFTQLLSVEEVHLAGGEGGLGEGVLHGAQPTVELGGCGMDPGAGLIVQVRVVGEPENGGPGVGGDVLGVLVGTEEQGLDDGRGHHRLAGPGGRGQGELGQDAVVLVVLPGPMQPVQDLLDGLGLVVLEGVTHGGQALRLIWKLCR